MDITLIANIIYGVSIGLIALGLLLGLVKGLWKTVFALFIQVILLLIAVFLAPTVGQALGSVNLSSFVDGATLTIGSEQVQVTSIRQTVCDALTASNLVSPLQGQTVYEAALALTDVILALASYILMSVLAVLLGWILAALLYHTVFKWFIPQRVRLNHKLRIGGAISGTVLGLVSATMMIAPFSSLASFLNDNKTTLASAKAKLGDEASYLDYVMAFGDSAYGSGWMGGLDDQMLDVATSVDTGDGTVDLNSIGSLVQGLGVPFVNALNSGDETDLFNYTTLMEPTASVNVIINTLIGSNLLMGIMPALCDAAVNYADGTITDYDLLGLSFADVDFTGDLTTLETIYGKIYATGLIDRLFNDNETYFTYQDKDQVVDSVKMLGSVDVVENNMPYLMALTAKALKAQTGYSILSEDVGAYEGVDWSTTLANAASAAFELADVAGLDIAKIGFEDLAGKIYDQLGDPDKVDRISQALVGSDPDEDTGSLLDTDLIDNGVIDFTQVGNLIYGMVPSLANYLSRADFVAALNTVGSSRATLKKEVETAIKMLPDVKVIADVSKEKTGSYEDLSISLRDDQQREALISMLNTASDSLVMTDIIPSALSKALPSLMEDVLGSSTFFGLSSYSFDLRGGGDFTSQIVSVLEIMPQVFAIYDTMNDDDLGIWTKIDDLGVDDLRTVIETIIDSSIINPERYQDGTTVKNSNINTVIQSIFASLGLSASGITIASDLYGVDWKVYGDNGTVAYPEVDRLLGLVEDIQANPDVFDGDQVHGTKLTGDLVADLVYEASQSQVISPTLTTILQNQADKYLSDEGFSLDFSAITDWETTSEAIGKLFDLGKPLYLEGDDLDYTAIPADYLNAVFTQIIRSGILPTKKKVGEDEFRDYVGDAIYEILDKSGILSDLGVDLSASDFYSIDPTTGDSLGWDWSTATSLAEVQLDGDYDPIEAYVTTAGELSDIFLSYQTINDIGIDTLTDGTASQGDVLAVLEALDDSTVLRKLAIYAINQSLLSIDPISLGDLTAAIDPAAADVDVLKEMDSQQERFAEYETISWLYEYANSGALEDLFSSSAITDLAADSKIAGLSRQEVFDDLLDRLTDSRIFSTAKSGYGYSFTDTIFASFYSVTRLDQMARGISLTVDLTPAQRQQVFAELAKTIASQDTASQEKAAIESMVSAIQGLDLDNLFGAPAALTLKKVESFLDAVSSSPTVGKASETYVSDLYQSIGLAQTVSAMNSDVAEALPGVVAYGLDLTAFERQTQLDYFYGFLEGLLGLAGKSPSDSLLTDAATDLTLTGASGTQLYGFLYNLGNSQYLYNVRAWIMRGLLQSVAIQVSATQQVTLLDYVRGSIGGSDTYKVGSVNALTFSDVTDSAVYLEECDVLSAFIGQMANSAPKAYEYVTDLDLSGLASVPLSVFSSTFSYADGSDDNAVVASVIRSPLASEMAANFVIGLLEDVSQTTLSASVKAIFYDDDYRGVNPVEGLAAGSLLALSLLVPDGAGKVDKEEVGQILTGLGMKVATVASLTDASSLTQGTDSTGAAYNYYRIYQAFFDTDFASVDGYDNNPAISKALAIAMANELPLLKADNGFTTMKALVTEYGTSGTFEALGEMLKASLA